MSRFGTRIHLYAIVTKKLKENPLMISEKLDFLMQITNTSNSVLGRAVSFDPSYISKIRRGIRKAPVTDAFIDPASELIARRLTDSRKRRIVSGTILGDSSLPSDTAECAAIIKKWLTANENDSSLEALLTGIANLPSNKISIPSPSQSNEKSHTPSESKVEIFYGNEGKREAVKSFLKKVILNSENVPYLLLFSNEDMKWMYESPSFASEWAALLVTILRKNITIKIIHTVQRDLNDMLEAVKKWMPLYTEGNIEPYYCPKIRDDIYRRSVFIAPGLAAVTSTSVLTGTEKMANLLFTDIAAVNAFEEELRAYMTLCKPLMKIYKNGGDMFMNICIKLFEKDNALNIAGAYPLFFLLPKKYLKEAADDFSKLKKDFIKLLKRGVKVREIFCEPLFREKNVTIWPGVDIEYTEEVWREHLNEVLKLRDEFDNYTPLISSTHIDIMEIIAAEDNNAAVMTPRPVVFDVFESNICASIYEYIGRIPGRNIG